MPIDFVYAPIPPFDAQAADAARARQNRLTKPTGSLGRLEELSVQLAGITGQALPAIEPPAIFVFAADHGVAAQGVSAYPAEVTAQMALNFARGGAVINTMAKQLHAKLVVTDVGVMMEFAPNLPINHRKVRPGTRDWTQEAAMTAEETLQAINAGRAVFQEAGQVGIALIGEMGIGNTATAAALSAALTGIRPELLTGRGTGLDDAGVARKLAVVQAGLARHGALTDPLEVIAALGGLEIAAMTGAILEAAAQRVPVLLDGFIAATAALAAYSLIPEVKPYLIAAHRSPEPGHSVLLNYLGLDPLLDLGMRLGEASGAAAALPLLRFAVAILREVATFEQAGVTDKE